MMMTNGSGCKAVAVRPCPICRQSSVERLHSMLFVLPSTSPLPDRYDVVACCRCGFVYADTSGSQEAYARHYTDFSLYEDPLTSTGSGSSEEDRQRFESIALFLGQCCPRNARILDIGCGSGGLLLALKAHGFNDLMGMDPSRRCVERLRRCQLEGVQGTLESIPKSIGRFDLIVLSHVLEHVLEPVRALASLGEILASDGRVYVETPDASRYGLYRFVPFYFFDTEHINHFGRVSLVNLAVASGFDMECVASKEIPVAGGQAYPAVYLFARRNRQARPGTLVKAHELPMAIASYVRTCAMREGEFAHLEENLDPTAPLALWGAGSFAHRFLQIPWLRQRQIVAVVDRDTRKHGIEFAGCVIGAPAAGLRKLPPETTVLMLIALDSGSAVGEYLRLGLPYRYRVVSDALGRNPAQGGRQTNESA